MAEQENRLKENRLICFGYLITDNQGFVQYQTFRPNRRAAWLALDTRCGERKGRDKFRRQGFRCVCVYARELGYRL